ncbi:non-ribosomal peptide synthase/polyketide synthase [Pseudomonas fluorescens]|uniref:Non-ribosomal peptide synthase/polyketide synthase n=1 Tax=Pseudomonas fluorescens TaxID=294 RepID=A0A944HKM5_PSEFL|nr:non-ribosomal peptide synthase/polyketide synthase [Pseudomonas fluorescens]MBT2296178.1 non-ribosomal peptide synthase/polyketide synthase [Pseudomonas fluorescens]MBT2310285.1 non-ribosomal peptide synthase/polyketide synthase [Pseudomonas fluorescens]MBT2313390.1 non-ribosomal peptide synthase/polyketide synthase [Pseudomonas fluorescens]MBT2320389.1 non-ribosomal peptide synthase/polyketide synthase [Pseudomonas fluorescens]MBT2331063.1 non-ribosomal peptide synthase/polyketide synthase
MDKSVALTIAKRFITLPLDKRKLYLEKMLEEGVSPANLPIPEVRLGFEHIPLSYAQERQWFLWQMDPHSSAYHIPNALRLKGQLDVPALERSFNALLERHESLRTTFVENGEQAVQVIHPNMPLCIAVQALTAGPLASLDDDIKAFVEAETARPFDLRQGPLLRVSLLKIAEGDHVLVLIQHHIIADGWSMQVLVDELVRYYAADIAGQPLVLPPLPVQYADYAIWQRHWLEAGERERQLAYWVQTLGDEQPVLELPLDHPRPPVQSFRGARLDLELPPQLGAALKQLAQREGASLFMVLLASFQALLHRYSGQPQIRVGVPVANRNRVETEGLIGFFVNTQVLNAHVDGQLPFDRLLAQVKQAAMAAQAHQDLPFEQLIEALQPERSLSHSPIFQVMFNHQTTSDGRDRQMQLPQLSIEDLVWEGRTAQFDLTLGTYETGQGVAAELTYATDLFEPQTIERLARHWQNLLQGIVDAPQQRIGELPLLDTAQQRLMQQDWHRVVDHGGAALCVHQRIAEQARKTPDALALIVDGQALSYGQLEARANQLAHRLIGLGVTPDQPVGIAVQRSAEMIVGLLAILKAGGAYVPLDPAYPEDRLAYMVQDSGIELLLTQAPLQAQLPIPATLQTLLLDQPDTAWLDAPRTCPEVPLTAEHLAYVIYTSGSTGKPKGVMVRHGALSNFVTSMIAQPGLTASDRMLSLTTFSFDIFGLEIYGPLSAGASIVLTGQDVHQDPQAVLALVEQHEVTVLQATPSSWRMLLDHEHSALLAGRTFLCGGEALPLELAQRLLALSPKVWNLYGPTETTIWSAVHPLSLESSRPFLGKPLDNTALYIVGSDLTLNPAGAPGELLIGGDGLARGYFQRPALTAERFVPDPFSTTGQRLYRTGDLTRYRAEGVVEYIGRIDHQVKIRGLRIELGEIEAALLAQDSVRETVVVAHEAPTGAQLVGYVVPATGEVADESSLRASLKAALKAQLPEYMVPAHLVFLAQLPLTPNGKVDRKALPAPDASQSQSAYEAPRTATQHSVAGIWQDVLKLERVGLTDHFFELGGHSLLVTQVITRVRQALKVQVPLRTLFEHSVLQDFVAALGVEQAHQEPPLVALPRQPLMPLSYAQERQWFLWQLEPTSSAYHIPAALRLRGALDLSALQRSFDALVARHESLRTRIVQQDGQAWQVIDPAAPLQILVQTVPADLDEDALKALVAQETRGLFDLQQGPLMRVRLLRLAVDDHVLVLTQHHIVSDGWSMQVMVDELMDGYAGFSAGTPRIRPSLAVQYADYAAWQRQWMDAGERDRQLGYWTARLGDNLPLLELPTDRARPAEQSYRGARLEVPVSASLAEGLKQLAQRENVTLFVVLLASFQALLHRYSGQADIRVGVPVANRNRVETEGLIGFFVNTQVLKAEIDSQQSLRSLLLQVHEAVLGAQAHQDLPFEQLVDALQPERSLSHSPLFQVMHNHQTRHPRQGAAQLSQVDAQALTWATDTAKFDLTLDTFESTDQVWAELTYATDLFDAATLERMARHWTNLLQALVADCGQRLGQVPLLDRAEEDATLRLWNPRLANFPGQTCLHQRIEAQALRTPDAVAVSYLDQHLSYGRLNEQANRLAHQLIEAGVGPDVPVGLGMERGLEMLVGLLAILKAGGAYVPLDPSYPEERLAYMIADSGIGLLVTQPQLRDRLPVPDTVRCLWMDENRSAYSAANPDVAMSPDNLAYVIYTSGSTGQPKGTLLAHHNVLRLFEATEQWFGFGADDVWSLFHSFAFDFSVWEIFGALLHGGRLVVVPYDTSRSPEDFHALLCREKITVLNQTPSAFKPLMQVACAAPMDAPPLSLRHVVFGGEALEVKNLRPWFERFGDSTPQLINMYGITETTVHVTYRPLTEADLLREASSPIGEPISDLSWYLLDGDLNPVAAGCIGELYIGRAGLARGYLNRADLTCLRFVPDPFGGEGGRLYRTGDLARYRADGVIDYIGRIDHQVKIRGFRIELGEIEARLLEQASIREATVLAMPGLSGPQLVAYLVPVDTGLLDDPALQSPWRDSVRAQLKATLPDHMLPAHLLLLERLPLTANGKLNRNALPSPDTSALQQTYHAPQSELEQRLAAIWQEVLKRPQVGLDDNFFELGGDSIISIQVVSRARQAGIRLNPKDLFQHQTVQRLARVAQLEDDQNPVDQQPVQGQALMLPIQQRFFEDDIPARHHWNQSVLLKPRVLLDADTLEQALRALMTHHDALRLGFTAQDAAWVAEYRPMEPLPDEWLWQADLTDTAELEALGNRAQRSLDLQNGPLLRAVLVNLADGDQRLLLVIHHLVVDGVSWRILLEDLQSAYQQLLNGQALKLPAKTSAFKDWSEHLQRYAASPALHEELAYWQDCLRDIRTDLPCERFDGSQQNHLQTTLMTRLDATLTRQLLQEAPSAYRTQVNDLLLTALARVIGRWTGQPSVLIQLEGHGREELFDDIDLTRTVGWFTSLFPVRLTPQAGVGDSIRQIKEQLRSIPNKGIGFGALRYFGDEPAQQTLACLPTPRITFNYLGQFDGSFEGDDAALWVPAHENAGLDQSADAPMGNWLTLNGQVYGGELSVGWSFSRERFKPETIERLSREYAEELAPLIGHCVQPENQGLTPSDFPLAGLTQAQLDALPMPVQQVVDVYPLSAMQQGMLFHSLYEQAAGDYINQVRLDVEGLEPQRFQQAWQAAVDRHDILRTGFVWQGLERAVQVVHKQLDMPFTVLDWRERSDTRAALDALAQAEQAKGFDLTHGPLLRMTVVRLDDLRCHLIYTNHHILMDGWSNSQLLGEVLQRYADQPVPATAGRYRDYIDWLQRQDPGVSQAWWSSQLADLQEPTRLAHAIQRSADDQPRAGHGERYQLIEAGQTRLLGEFARQQKVTLNTLVQAAWLILLQRLTGQQTVAFGATVAGRPTELAGVEQQIGLFINTLPVIASPSPMQTVGQWLQSVQAQNLALREHEHTPLFDIQRWAGQNGEALFDNILVFENYPVSQALEQGAPGQLRFSQIRNHEQTNYPLTVVVNAGDTLSLQYSYQREAFAEGAIEQLSSLLGNLLGQMTQSADTTLGELALLHVGQTQVIEQWNATAVAFPLEQGVHSLIEAQAQRTPHAMALVFGDQSLSYSQLNAQANQLAHALIERQVGPDTLVGIAVERSLEMVVGLLAILKAGGAYVPLDPEYPRERLSYMIQDSGIGLLLTQAHLLDDLPVPEDLPNLCLEPSGEAFAGYPRVDPQIAYSPENLAYVIYTSGSTGQPKGAGNAHRALTNRLLWMQQAYALTPADTVLQKTPFSFDVSVWEFFWPLMVGARLVVAAPGDHRDPARLIELINREQVSTLHFVPSMLQAFLQDARVHCCTSLTRIVCSGEALPVEAQLQVFAKLPGAGLYNLYGPTEAAIDVTHWTCREEGRDSVPIGEPIANLSTYILDSGLNPLPVGVAGELYLGGVGLARGYHRRPGLSAERFVASPFGAGQRLYRTGDLARYRADGVIEYVGRIDHQVKLRGLRIELGEIEARLMAHDAVREAVVVAQNVAGSQQLVAYMVPVDPAEPAANGLLNEQLGAWLGESLPDYMVPTHRVWIEQMPLSPNGKLDRKRLPALDLAVGQHVAPINATERTLVDIWQAVLGLEQIGTMDNFFALGADSIISIQVVSRAREQGIDLSPKDIFQRPTIRQLAERVLSAEGSIPPVTVLLDMPLHGLTDQQVRELPLPQNRLDGLYRLSPMQQGMLFLGLNSPEADLYINQLSIPVRGLDPERFKAAWEAVSQRHDILRTGFLWQDMAEPLQFVLADVALPVSLLDWRDQDTSAQALQQLAARERAKGFDLDCPPLQRLVLVRIAEDSYQLIWTYHHILIDGWSSSQLIGEVLSHYSGRAVPEAVPYRHYINWLAQQDAAAGESFWRRHLADLDEPTYLADTVPRKPGQGSGHEALYSRLGEARTEQLKAFARNQQVTLNTVVQGAWLVLLSRYSGQRCVAFGATVAGRPASLPASESILGLFINTLPVIKEVRAEQPVGQWLRDLQDYNLDMREREYTPLTDVQRWAGRAGQSLFDSIIVFENHPIDQALREWRDDSLSFGESSSAGLTNFPMDLMVTLEEGLVIEYMFLREHFDRTTVEGIRANMEGLLAALCEDAARPLGGIGLLTGQALTPVPAEHLPATLPVHQRIGQWAAQCSEQTAVIFDGQQLSYGQLETRANRLAHRLIAEGVGPDVRVGVALPRSEQMIVALLAVLKAGGAYVPLDATYPRERLSYLMRDSGIALLLSDSSLDSVLPTQDNLHVLALDRLDLSALPVTAPEVSVQPENLAYVIYTSGSTGLPKGVGVAHEALAMHCQAIGKRYEMSEADCELHFMSFAFDGAHERWLTTLTHGGRLLIRDDSLWTAEQTFNALHEHGVTVAAFPPVYLQQLAEHAEQQGNPPPVRVYCFGGDAVPAASFELAKRALKPRYIINGYGPTETVVTPLIWKAGAQDECGAAYAPIGSLVGQRSGYVLDSDLNRLPAGVAGELYLGGALARGYLGRAGGTAERFVADPFSADGARLYRTGDLVRQREDGTIDYLGRIDQQVKIRGFRIEPGEIEARLKQQPGVRDAAVVAREGANGKQLIGYVLPSDATPVEGLCERLRGQLKANLPDYMVPAQLMLLERMPLTPNGKLDRKALPDPGADQARQAYIAPRSELEKALVTIWQDVLKIERIGVTDHFFELGGDSILSLQVVARSRPLKAQGLSLKLRDLMQKPTIAQLVAGLQGETSAPSRLLSMNTEVRGTAPLFCIHAGFGTVFDYEPLARRLSGVRQVLAVQSTMLLDATWQDESLPAMASAYVKQIRQHQPQGPYYLLGWSLGGTLALLMAAQLERDGQRVEFVGLVDSFVPSAAVNRHAVDDWRSDLRDFVRVTVPEARLPLLIEEEETPANVRALLAMALVNDGVASTYMALGVDELAHVFSVARRLKQLSLQLDRCSPVEVEPTCWWTPGRETEALELAAQLQQPVQGERIDCGHFQIPRNETFLAGAEEVLAQIVESEVLS